MWKIAQYALSSASTSRAGTLLESRNGQAYWHQRFWGNACGLARDNNHMGWGAHCCTSSGSKSRISFPWTTPALLMRIVGSPIYNRHSLYVACIWKTDKTHFFHDFLGHCFNFFPFWHVTFVVCDIIYMLVSTGRLPESGDTYDFRWR